MRTYFDKGLQQELNAIPLEIKETYKITDSIAKKIEDVMNKKGISKKQLAEKTHKQPSEITKWLAGGHNFTCKTIALISMALNEPIIKITE